MEEKKDNRGGVRINSGRKKLSNGEKKVEIKFWIENKYTFPFGGVEKAKGFAMEMIKNGNNPVMERVSIQNLNEPTHQIKPITDEKPTTNYAVNIEPKPISSVVGDFEGMKKKILACERIAEIEAIYKEIKSGLFTFRQKAELENLAKQHSTTFYND